MAAPAARRERPHDVRDAHANVRRAGGTGDRLRVHVTGETELYNLQTNPFEHAAETTRLITELPRAPAGP